jgi:Holliday junction resolvase-like predicted endonuclease
MQKSSRHSKITGDFGEALVLYWLSKRGFECARVDHTGIDLIARRPKSTEVLGISVKSRSRNEGKESDGINLRKAEHHKIESACRAFRCIPCMAVVADQGDRVRAFLFSLRRLRALAPGGQWGMTPAKIEMYKRDASIESFELESRDGDWRALT